MRPLLAIFCGGASSRMGSPKGRLRVPRGAPASPLDPSIDARTGQPIGDEALIERLARAGAEAGLDRWLIGDASPYDGLLPDLPRIPDQPAGIGPLGGLAASLRHRLGSQPTSEEASRVITVACDMPNIDAAILERLLAIDTDASVVAPAHADGTFEPMLARWDARSVLPPLERAIDEGIRSFQALFARLQVESLPIDPPLARALIDWDTPEDIGRF